MHGEEGSAAAATIRVDTRARSEHRDTAIREGIDGGGLRPPAGMRGIPLQVLGVLRELADQEDRVFFLEGYGYKRAVGAILPAGMARVNKVPVEIWATNVRARSAWVGVGIFTSYSGSGCDTGRPGVCIFTHGSPDWRSATFADRNWNPREPARSSATPATAARPPASARNAEFLNRNQPARTLPTTWVRRSPYR